MHALIIGTQINKRSALQLSKQLQIIGTNSFIIHLKDGIIFFLAKKLSPLTIRAFRRSCLSISKNVILRQIFDQLLLYIINIRVIKIIDRVSPEISHFKHIYINGTVLAQNLQCQLTGSRKIPLPLLVCFICICHLIDRLIRVCKQRSLTVFIVRRQEHIIHKTKDEQDHDHHKYHDQNQFCTDRMYHFDRMYAPFFFCHSQTSFLHYFLSVPISYHFT